MKQIDLTIENFRIYCSSLHLTNLFDSEGYCNENNYKKNNACKGDNIINLHLKGANILINIEKILSIHRVDKKILCIDNEQSIDLLENLPLYVKKTARKCFSDFLNKEMKVSGIPVVKKWYWPNGARSFFSFRADMDEGNEPSLQRFLNTIVPWSNSLSLFVCGKAYVGKEHLLCQVVDLGAEIGNHTFTHYVFAGKKRNRKNLELTETLLSKVGVVPRGYVGPASFWHPSMYDVLEEKGYDYTSSFGVDHDNFPYFLPKNSTQSYSMVEIPFHCLGDRFPKFGLALDSEKVGKFFDQLLEKKYHLCEPMFIYGHPDMPRRMGAHPELVRRICEKALSYDDVCTGNMADIASWWKRRHSTIANIQFDRENNRVFATDYQGDPDVYWSLQITDDCKYLVSGTDIQRGVHLDDLGRYKKIDLKNIPFADIGEIVEVPSEQISLRSKLGDLRQDFRRKRRMVRELNAANLKMKGSNL